MIYMIAILLTIGTWLLDAIYGWRYRRIAFGRYLLLLLCAQGANFISVVFVVLVFVRREPVEAPLPYLVFLFWSELILSILGVFILYKIYHIVNHSLHDNSTSV